MREKRIHKKKMTKFGKRVSLLVVALVAFIGTTIFAFAANPTFTATADKSEYEVGETVTIAVDASNMPDKLAGYSYNLKYDSDSFTFVNGGKSGSYYEELDSHDPALASPFLTAEGADTVKYFYGIEQKNYPNTPIEYKDDVVVNGKVKLTTLVFKVKRTAKGGSHDFTFESATYDNMNKDKTPVKAIKATVKVIKHVDDNSIKLGGSSYSLRKGESNSIKVNYLPDDTTDSKEFTYSSDKPDVASVDENGKITANAVGTAKITVTAFGKELTADVTVTNHAKSIDLDSKMTITKGNKKQLTATVTPKDADDGTITWSSSSDEIATVDSDGTVTGVAGGTAVITAKTAGGLEAKCSVNVDAPITGISIKDASDFILTKGGAETKQLTANIEPDDATGNKTITWTSSDTSVATVDSNGLVTLVGKNKENGNNTAKITASVGSGTEKKEAYVTVKVVVPITSFTIKSTNTDTAKIDLYPGEDYKVDTIIGNYDITTESTNITWSSSDNAGTIATVADGKISAKGVGDATITGKLANGKKVTVNVHVKQPITGITLSGNDNMTIEKYAKDKTKLIVSKYEPENKEQDTAVTWSSSNEKVAKISSDGTITPLTTGDVTFTATLNANKNITASRKVKIVAALQDAKISNIKDGKVEIGKDKTFTPDVTITPSDTTDSKSITWSSNSDVAEVNEKGVVTGKKGGNATITGKLANGKTITYTVSVVVPIDKVTIDKTGITNNTVTLNRTNNDTYKVNAEVGPSDNTESDKTIKYDSSNKKVATVSSLGVVTPISGGTTTITAYAGKNKVKDSITVNVIVPMESLSLNKNEITINRKSSESLVATAYPLDNTDSKTITWTSDHPEIASVDKFGSVTGVSDGTAVITASALDGKFTATCSVTVKRVYIDKISSSDISLEVGKGDDLKNYITYTPSNATETEGMTYESDDENVVSVTENGHIFGISEGDALITITTSNGKTTKAKVTVKNALNVRLVTPKKDILTYLSDSGSALYDDSSIKDATSVRLYASVIDSVSDTDKNLVATKLGDNDKVVNYLNFNLYLLNDKKIMGYATNLSKSVKITIDVPADVIKSGRKFSIIRIHDGGADKLIDLDDNDATITFETDKFSTYAIVYEEEKSADNSNNNSSIEEENPNTSNDVMKYIIALLASLAAGGVSVYALKKAK